MITNFKIFESINKSKKPNIGDYVILKNDIYQTQSQPEIVSYINTHIGKIIDIKIKNYKIKSIKPDNYVKNEIILIEYDYPKYKIQTKIYRFDDIKYWSNDYNDLLSLLKTIKYNL